MLKKLCHTVILTFLFEFDIKTFLSIVFFDDRWSFVPPSVSCSYHVVWHYSCKCNLVSCFKSRKCLSHGDNHMFCSKISFIHSSFSFMRVLICIGWVDFLVARDYRFWVVVKYCCSVGCIGVVEPVCVGCGK